MFSFVNFEYVFGFFLYFFKSLYSFQFTYVTVLEIDGILNLFIIFIKYVSSGAAQQVPNK